MTVFKICLFFSLINATHILNIAYLQSCLPDPSASSSSTKTVESKFIIKSIKNRVQKFAYHQKSINSLIIMGTAGNKSQKSGKGWSAREISTLPPKPRAEGSSPSAPAIDQGARKRLHFGVCGLFPCKNRLNGHAL